MSVGVGVIGTGVMGSEHARLLSREIPAAHLAGVFDADAARAQAAAAGAAVFPDPRSLIASDRVGAVIVASPDATHAELALACLEAGKPVLCEKPLASSAAEALRVVQAEVALKRRLIQVGYMRRFDPGYQEMKRIKDEGGVGATMLLHNVHRNARAPGVVYRTDGGDEFVRARDRYQPMADRIGNGLGSCRQRARRRSADDHDADRPRRDRVDRGLYERRLRLSCPCRTGGSAGNGRAGAALAHDAQQGPHWRGLLSRQLGSALRRRLSQAIDRLDWRGDDRNSGRGRAPGTVTSPPPSPSRS